MYIMYNMYMPIAARELNSISLEILAESKSLAINSKIAVLVTFCQQNNYAFTFL